MGETAGQEWELVCGPAFAAGVAASLAPVTIVSILLFVLVGVFAAAVVAVCRAISAPIILRDLSRQRLSGSAWDVVWEPTLRTGTWMHLSATAVLFVMLSVELTDAPILSFETLQVLLVTAVYAVLVSLLVFLIFTMTLISLTAWVMERTLLRPVTPLRSNL